MDVSNKFALVAEWLWSIISAGRDVENDLSTREEIANFFLKNGIFSVEDSSNKERILTEYDQAGRLARITFFFDFNGKTVSVSV